MGRCSNPLSCRPGPTVPFFRRARQFLLLEETSDDLSQSKALSAQIVSTCADAELQGRRLVLPAAPACLPERWHHTASWPGATAPHMCTFPPRQNKLGQSDREQVGPGNTYVCGFLSMVCRCVHSLHLDPSSPGDLSTSSCRAVGIALMLPPLTLRGRPAGTGPRVPVTCKENNPIKTPEGLPFLFLLPAADSFDVWVICGHRKFQKESLFREVRMERQRRMPLISWAWVILFPSPETTE